MPHHVHQQLSHDARAALGSLINLSGKMRMLSHRVTVFVLSASLSRETSGSDRRLRAALNEFCNIHAILKDGNPQLGIPAAAIALISDGEALGPEAHRIIDSFVERTEALTRSREPKEDDLTAFVEFVAGPLLDRLNLITNHISHVQEQLHERQQQQIASNEAAVHEALAAIEKVSVNVRIIAINAATEAVRAGEFGRGFSIIAKEIRALSDRAADLVQSVRANLRHDAPAL
jgi:methyl-accepting chemotaxis protein